MHITFVIFVPILILLFIYFLMNTKSLNKTDFKISVKNTVLEKEGEQVRSKSKGIKYHVPKFMLELYENSRDFSIRSNPDIVKSLIPKEYDTVLENEINQNKLIRNHFLIFELPVTNEDETFTNAEFKILIIANNSTFLTQNSIIKLSIFDEKTKLIKPLSKIQIHHNNTWISFNLTESVFEILSENTTPKVLRIVLTLKESFKNLDNGLQLSLKPFKDGDLNHDYPVLLLSYISKDKNEIFRDNSTITRAKRNIEEDYEEMSNNVWDEEYNRKLQIKKKKLRNVCKRKSLYVDFSEIEYDYWILQPRGYDAFQCQGRCFYPIADHLSPTKHAIVQALVYSVAPMKTSKLCCVPTKLESISILYVDNKGVLTYRYAYKDMVVAECGCR